jgi:AbrB family looped-hinge helix DNA binding protein
MSTHDLEDVLGDGDNTAGTITARIALRKIAKSISTVNTRGQITIPKVLRQEMHVAPGDQLFWEQVSHGFRLSAFPPRTPQAICANTYEDTFCAICIEPATGQQVTFPGVREQTLVARDVPPSLLQAARRKPRCWYDVSTGLEIKVYTPGRWSYRVREPK